MINKLVKVSDEKDIFSQYRNTPVDNLLKYHNLGHSFEKHAKAEMVISMCMDNRKQLTIPNNFAYILRSGGGNLRYSEFKLSYSIAIGGVKTLALIAHNNCGMVNLMSKKDKFINGLVQNAGWSQKQAEEHFTSFAPMFEIENEMDFTLNECKRLRNRYPKISVIPLFYNLEDNQLYQIEEN